MGTKLVINMKLFVVTLFLCLATSLEAQTIHLWYNIDNQCKFNKIIKKNGDILFKIENQFFKYDKNNQIEKLTSKEIKGLNVININKFLKIATKKREELIREDSVKILSNKEVFDKIYLYEKIRNGNIKRYVVFWSSMLE